MRNSLKTTLTILAASAALALPARAGLRADPPVLFQRDLTYEQALRFESSMDKTITPAKVIRWLFSNSTFAKAPPSSTEFQPIVDVDNTRVRLIAAIAYKF